MTNKKIKDKNKEPKPIIASPYGNMTSIKEEKKKCHHKWQAVPMNNDMATRFYMSGCEVIVVCTKCLEKRYI